MIVAIMGKLILEFLVKETCVEVKVREAASDCHVNFYPKNIPGNLLNALRLDKVILFGMAQAPLKGSSSPRGAVDSVQEAVLAVQRGMGHFEGSLVQFRCDEKGFLSICAFGLPGASHEDGPSRAVRAALMIASTLKKVDQVKAHINLSKWCLPKSAVTLPIQGDVVLK